ncbi:MAG: flagellar biosynthesis protein FlhF [Ignavibacteriales bacterium]
MKIRKFTAATLKEATELMKSELGSEAIILGTRVITKETNLGKIREFEISAGIEEGNKIGHETILDEQEDESLSKFEKEFLKESKKISTENLEFIPGKIFQKKKSAEEAILSKDTLNNAVEELLNKEISKPIVKSLISQIKKSQNLVNDANLNSYIISGIASMISTTHFEIEKKKKQKVVAIVGPTGVGKTTCIAKLAAISKILHNLNVGIISIDTYRLGAIDQLRIFSDISNIDMLVAYQPEDMPKLMKQLKDKDIVFIDTAGRSQKNTDELKKSKEFFSKIKIDDIYLVLSATSSSRTLYEVAENFKMLDYNALIFSKVDEAVVFGNMLNLMLKTNIPIIYLTNGQVIPDDIISADPEFIANMIFTGKLLQ